jgi:hypothetical protein
MISLDQKKKKELQSVGRVIGHLFTLPTEAHACALFGWIPLLISMQAQAERDISWVHYYE